MPDGALHVAAAYAISAFTLAVWFAMIARRVRSTAAALRELDGSEDGRR